MLVTVFNDINPKHTRSLQQEINSLQNIHQLKHQPIVLNEEVCKNIIQYINKLPSIPKLFFIDPCGYKGLSLQLISSAISGWGCDCIFFFNYNRINAALSNPVSTQLMEDLFGKEKATSLKTKLQSKSPQERELTIIEELAEALQAIGGEYVLPFCFKNERGTRTSHHLIFVSKHVLGYSIMKEIMAKESSTEQQGVASFEYNPATRDQPLLFELSRPRDDLKNMLLDEFAGQSILVKEIYESHHVGKPYIEKNYKEVLLQLEAEGKITADPSKRKKNTMADRVMITFPPKQ
jgi:three-Cys-motif partner protein